MPFEQPLFQNEKLFRHLFYQASLGIAVENLEGRVLLANPALCSMLGYEEEELRRMHCAEFASPEDSEDDWALFQKLRAGAIDHYALDKRYIRKDGTRIWGRLNVSLLGDANEGNPAVFALVEDVTDRKRAEEALSSVSRRLIQAQEQERARIARELHDHVSQRVALVAIQLERLKSELSDSSPEILRQTDKLRNEMSEISLEVQALSHELHSPNLEYLGLGAVMRTFCHEFSSQQKVEVNFEQQDVPRVVPQQISLNLFRVLQEGLHNALKHSGVQHFEVTLYAKSDAIELIISDAGIGFDTQAASHYTGLGLVSMKERLQLVNGTLTIESQVNRGTTIRASAPLNPEENSLRAAG